jgi:hypothetical protein
LDVCFLFLTVILVLFVVPFKEWVLWEHRSAGAGGTKDASKWKENMSELCRFQSVESFWQFFNHIPQPSDVFFDGENRKKVGPEGRTVEEYSLFKKGIEPEWGDPQNVSGGEWFCRQYFEADLLDLYWQNLVLAAVGESLEDCIEDDKEDHINGVRVVDKSRGFPMYKLEIWLKTRNPDVVQKVRAKLMEVITDGQPQTRKAHPKFDWKDHSA